MVGLTTSLQFSHSPLFTVGFQPPHRMFVHSLILLRRRDQQAMPHNLCSSTNAHFSLKTLWGPRRIPNQVMSEMKRGFCFFFYFDTIQQLSRCLNKWKRNQLILYQNRIPHFSVEQKSTDLLTWLPRFLGMDGFGSLGLTAADGAVSKSIVVN